MKNNQLNNAHKTDRSISVCIITIYIGLFIFGIISMTDPEWLINISKENRKQEVSSLVNEGIQLSKLTKDFEAIEKYTKALDMIPDFSEALINMGVSYKRLKQYDNALKIFNDALETSPNDSSNIYSNLKDIYLELNDTAKARLFFELSISSNRYTIDKFMKKGNYYLSIMLKDSALSAYNEALEARMNMITYILSSFEHEKIEHLKNHEEINRQIKKYERLKSLENLKNFDEKCFLQILKTDKGLAENYNKSGFVLALNGDYKNALINFYQAINIWSDYQDANMNIKFINEKLKSEIH